MKRVSAILAAFFVLAPTAAAHTNAGPKPFHAVTSAPTGLHAFLLTPDEVTQKYYPRTPSFAWSPADERAGTYDFELATSRSFNDAAVLFSYTKLTIPAVSVAHQLPWMTGVPYALWAHVRWVSKDGKRITPWSAPLGFNMRWSDSDYPQQLDAPEGLVRWKPIEGATRYEVLFPDINPPLSFQTTTNVADEREFFSFKQNSMLWSAVRWRVRAIRYIDDKDLLKNGLPRVSYGPWSQTFTSVNPPQSLGLLGTTATVSDTWDKSGQPAAPHDLTPGFAWTPSAPVLSSPGSFGSSLYRVYIFTDDHCVNQVFAGSIVGSPAFAPRVVGGPLKLPQSQKILAQWTTPPYLVEAGGDEGHSFDATGKAVKSNELPGKGNSPVNGNTVADANVDLWDSGWPNGRYYWTVVPVTVDFFPPFDPASTDKAIEYHDTTVPQDQCQAGVGMSFGKVSQPVVTAGTDTPWVAGLAPNGRVVASAKKVPTIHDSPLVAWQPAIGATNYEVQVSRRSYPWKTTWSTTTAATSVVLPLGKTDVGTWWYRIRGINPALPTGAQAMSWSNPVRLRITGDSFVVVKKK